MKRAYVETAAGIGIATALFLGGFFVASAIKMPFTGNGDAATWAGAFGTVLAFAGTIWIATRETRRRNRESHTRARLTAPGIAMKLVRLRLVVVQSLGRLGGDKVLTRDDLLGCARQLGEEQLWSLDDIVPLTCLPNDCAINLALVREIVSTVIKTLVEPPGRLDAMVGDAVQLLSTALFRLDAAFKECEAVYEKTKYEM